MSVVKGFVVKDTLKINHFEDRAVAHARVAITEGSRRFDKEKNDYVPIEGRTPLFIGIEFWGTQEVVHKHFDSLQNSTQLIEFTGSLCMKAYKREDGTQSVTPFMQVSSVSVLQKKSSQQ